jgi:hypothetical protein
VGFPRPIPGDVASVFGRTGVVTATAGDYTVAKVTGAAPLASPSFTGIVSEPSTNTSGGAAYTNPTLANSTAGSVINATEDTMLYLEVTTIFVALVISMGPAATPTNAIFTSAACPVGAVITIRVPAGWFVATSYSSGAFSQAAVTC